MAQDKYGYIPPSVKQAMDQSMSRMPANLQKYQSGNTYIPSGAAKQMSSYMSKNMPAHMKQYVEPYMQQKTTAGLNSLDPGTMRTPQQRAPTPDLMRRDHSAHGQQFSVNIDTNNPSNSQKSLSYSPQYSGGQNNAPPAPPPAPLPNPSTGSGQGGSSNPYDFIMSSNQPKRGMGSGLGGGSMVQRLLVVVIGAVLLIIVAVVLFSVILGGDKSSSVGLTDLAQRQAEIARVADIGLQKGTSTATKNFAHTTKLTVLSSQQQVIAILKKNGQKLEAKQLGIKKSVETDKQLEAAAANNSFDETFNKLLAQELLSYQAALQSTFNASASNTEKAVLQEGFNGVTVLVASKKTT